MPRSTSRLLLRPPQPDDLDAFFAIHGDPATNQFNPSGPCPSIEQAQEYLTTWIKHWHDHGFGQWAITTQAEPHTVIGFGGVSFRQYGDVQRLNLGYRFAASAWGRGYATELSQAGLDFAFLELAMSEVYAVVRPGHLASIHVLQKIGMHQVDVLDDVPGQAASYVFRVGRA
ncbi:MAG: GNAT family N-acetyltransferase [Pseudomonas sp.]